MLDIDKRACYASVIFELLSPTTDKKWEAQLLQYSSRLLSDTYLRLINKNKRSLVSVLKESRNNFSSPLVKILLTSFETLGLQYFNFLSWIHFTPEIWLTGRLPSKSLKDTKVPLHSVHKR